MSHPPLPALQFDLLDGNRRVGWVQDGTVGFRGFANEAEAAHAAWVAHRTLARRLERRHGGVAPPRDVEPVSVAPAGDREVILVSDRPIATLLRPGAESRAGPESFGFEIEVPLRAEELTMRSIAYRMYRTLRSSGVGWARWMPGDPRAAPRDAAAVADRGTSGADDETDNVSDASMQSFPASDPPGWIRMWAGAPTTDAERRGKDSE